MNTLLHWLTSPEWALIVKALLHSLWQGALIAVGMALVFRWVVNPSTRYRLALAALGVLFTVSLVTWGVLNTPQTTLPVVPQVVEPVAAAPVAVGPVQKFVVIANRTPSRPSTQWTAWLALAWLLGASAMLGRASVKIAGAEQLRRSCRPLNDARITELVAEARRAVKLTRQVRLAVTNQLTSPAVVGVLVPTLILPLSLITTLTPDQLRFILLHELAHIRRGDYLANLFQLFTEALFFFNPAVWWLSHQIRREREACCDALAIELSGAPADYARTLVSVAETILNPSPAAAPAFGNEREPSSLSDRVQRLLVPGYRPSLRLTWRAMLAALVAGGVLLGLLAAGARETVAATATLLESKAASTLPNLEQSSAADAFRMWQHELAIVGETNHKESLEVLLREVEQSSFAEAYAAWRQEKKALAEQRGTNVFYSTPTGVTDSQTGKFIPSRIAALQCRLGREAHLNESFLLRELATDAEVHQIFESSPRLCEKYGIHSMALVQFNPEQGYINKLNSGYSPQIQQQLWLKTTANVDLQTDGLTNGSQSIPSGINKTTATINPATGLPEGGGLAIPESQETKGKASSITVSSESATFNSTEGTMTARGNVEVTAANGMKITTEEARIQMGTNSAAIGANTNLYTRTFKVDTNEFARALGMVGPVAATNFPAALSNFFSGLGVDLLAPGKTVFYGDRRGALLVRASLADLDKIEQALQVLSKPVPQIHITAKFIEVPDKLMTNSLFKFILETNKVGSLSGVLTDPQARVLFKALEQAEGVEILSAPSITTLSGRQAQIQVIEMKSLITGETPIITEDGMEVRQLQTTNMPFGPVLDVFPTVTADGRSIQMVVIPTVTEFLGYDDPGSGVSSKVPIPHYRVRQIPTSTPNNISDGQTLVLGGFVAEQKTVTMQEPPVLGDLPVVSRLFSEELAKREKKKLLIFVTATIIDASGNRVRTYEATAGKVGAAPKSNPVFPGTPR